MEMVRSPGRTREPCALSLPHLMHFAYIMSGIVAVSLEASSFSIFAAQSKYCLSERQPR
jgi:hypothetical protein